MTGGDADNNLDYREIVQEYGPPITTPRGRTNFAVSSRILSLPGRRRTPHLFSWWLRDKHQLPIRIKGHGVCCACPATALAAPETLCSPSRPIVASKRARTDLWFRHVLSPGDQPAWWLAIRAAASPLLRQGRWWRCNQVSWLCQPFGGTTTTAPLLISERSRHVEGLTALRWRGSSPAPACGPPP